MDTATHAIFGAVVAQAGFRRSLGRRAMVYGAVGAMLPDIDSLAGLAGPYAAWLWHRGLTHSVFFGVGMGLLIGWMVWRRHRDRIDDAGSALTAWTGLCVTVLLTHSLLDLFTHYGTQLLAPFSNHRFAIPAMPIIDPLYTLCLLVAASVGLSARIPIAVARGVAAAALLAVGVYTLYGWSVNDRVADAARRHLASEGRLVGQVDAYPTLLQPFYRRVVVEAPDEVLIGFVSVLVERPIRWERFAKGGGPLTVVVADTWEGEVFRWFADGKVFWRSRPIPTGRAVEGFDLRYGLPDDSVLGFWGIEAEFDASGGMRSVPRVFSIERRVTIERLEHFFRLVFG